MNSVNALKSSVRILPLAGILLVSFGIGGAGAQSLALTFDPVNMHGETGTTLTYNATLTNNGDSEIFLNGAEYNLGDPSFTADESPFYNNFPASLLAGQSVQGGIVDLTIGSSTLPGDYLNSFTVKGGLDELAQDNLVTANFITRVDVPAPGSLVCALVGAVPGILLFSRRRKGTAQG